MDPLLASLQGLIDASPPAMWVGWYLGMDEGQEKQEIKNVLLDGELLRDLTDPTVKAELLRVGMRNAEFLATIMVEPIGDREVPD